MKWDRSLCLSSGDRCIRCGSHLFVWTPLQPTVTRRQAKNMKYFISCSLMISIYLVKSCLIKVKYIMTCLNKFWDTIGQKFKKKTKSKIKIRKHNAKKKERNCLDSCVSFKLIFAQCLASRIQRQGVRTLILFVVSKFLLPLANFYSSYPVNKIWKPKHKL